MPESFFYAKARNRLCVEFPKNMQAIRKGKVEYIIVPASMEARNKIESVILKNYYEKIRNKTAYIKSGQFDIEGI